MRAGWKTSTTGVFPVSCGGVTASRSTIVKTAERLSFPSTPHTSAQHAAAVISLRKAMSWIRGSALPCGRLLRWDGLNRPVSYTHLRAHETRHDLVCRLLL